MDKDSGFTASEPGSSLIGCADVGEWRPIETAPRDGTPFLATQGGEVYVAAYVGSEPRRIAFRTHQLRVESKRRVIDAEMDGEPVKAEVPVEQPWPEKFHHDWCYWTRGFDFKPTHWHHIDAPPSLHREAIADAPCAEGVNPKSPEDIP